MGCGRSRHRSPSLHPDGSYKEKGGDGDKKDVKRAGKKQKQQPPQADKQEKTAAKAVIKRENEPDKYSPKKTTNGRAGGGDSDTGKPEAKGGGGATGREGGAKRQWQLEEVVDTPPETVMAVYKSSVPASARASLSPAPSQPRGSAQNNPSLSVNGALVNGGTYKPGSLSHDMEMQNEIPDKASKNNASAPSNAKPVHITSSQLEFFRMLDERIEGGPDYSTDDE